MPTRSDIFDQIDSELASPNKSYSHLQPRKLVNNFVKVWVEHFKFAYTLSGLMIFILTPLLIDL